MSIIYKYYDFDQELTIQQTQMQNSNYHKYKYVNDTLKVIYWIKKGEIVGGRYFLSSGELITSELIQEYCTQNQWHFTFYTLVNSSGNYSLWNGNHYNSQGVNTSKNQLVLDEDGFNIAYASLDFDTETIKFGFKRYYEVNPDNGKKEVLVQFDYKRQTFEADSFTDVKNLWDFVYGGARIEKIYDPEVMEHFVYDNHPYFHNLLPLLPVGGIV